MLGVMTHWVTIEIVCVCVLVVAYGDAFGLLGCAHLACYTQKGKEIALKECFSKNMNYKHTNFSNQSDKTVSFVATKLMRLTNGSLFSGSDYKPLIISRIIHVKFIRHWTWRMNKNKTRLHCSNRMTSSKRAAIMERWNTHSLRHLFLSLSVHLLFIHATKSK